jgi:HD-like signal output (HDOD) protein
MKRILFVDDEVAVLEGLRNVLRRERRQWDMAFAESGEAALALMAGSHFDVVVSDMRMPAMSGLELLEQVRHDHPAAVRIALTGYADQEMVARASSVTHQQLAKPCEPDALRAVLERACSFCDLLANEGLRRVIGTLSGLPSAPASYQALTTAMADPGVTMKRLAGIVEKDLGVASRVLKFVNSAYFGFSRKIGNIEEAIVCIGLNALRHLVLSTEVFGAFASDVADYAPEPLEEHALLTARIAQRIVSDPKQGELAFAAGLLHDAGKLVLVSRLADRCREASALARREGKPLHEAERELIGADHAEIGAYLLGLWGLPAAIIDAVVSHHLPLPAEPRAGDLAVQVNVAHILAHEALAGRHQPAGADGGAQALADGLLQPVWQHVAEWRRLATDEAQRLTSATAAG